MNIWLFRHVSYRINHEYTKLWKDHELTILGCPHNSAILCEAWTPLEVGVPRCRFPKLVQHPYDTCRKSQINVPKKMVYFVASTLWISVPEWHSYHTGRTIQISVSKKYVFFLCFKTPLYIFFGQISFTSKELKTSLLIRIFLTLLIIDG